MTSAGPRLGQRQQQIRLVLVLLVLVVAAYGAYRQSRVQRPEAHQPAAGAAASSGPSKAAEHLDQPQSSHASKIIPGQTIFDLEGEVVYQGDVELSKTLSRIESGKLLRFGNDGATFQNRERRLPRKPVGYYKEYVHPTPGLSGPGPQRIVVGQEGEVYYTPDHYATFQRVDK